MKINEIFFTLVLLFSSNVTNAELSQFNVGLNVRFSTLPKIQTLHGHIERYGYTQGEFILNTPISIRYYSKSLISFQYQLEYRKENNTYDGDFGNRIQTSNKFLISSFNFLLKLNKPKASNTALSFGLKFFKSFLQEYSFIQRPDHGDSTFVFSSSKFQNLKTGLNIAISRETSIKKSHFSIYREIFYNTFIYSKSAKIPVLYSNEIGFTIGLAYNFELKKTDRKNQQ